MINKFSIDGTEISFKRLISKKHKSKINKIKLKADEKNIQAYIDSSQSTSTKRAYSSDLRHFLAHGGVVPCKPKQLAKYLADSANNGLSVATLERRITAIHKIHIDHKLVSPTRSKIVSQVMQGIRRTLGTKQRQAKPLTKDDLLAALEAIEKVHMPVRVARDRAILLVGFASAMRRSELIGVCMEHLSFSPVGLEIAIPLSKTDQERHGRTVFIPRARGSRCPVTALMHWLKTAGISSGYVFRSVNRYDSISKQGLTAQSVALIVKAAMGQIGADPQNFSGHSLRAGYCTSAAEQGQQSWQIRMQTGHKSDVTLVKYIRASARQCAQSLL